MYKEIITDRLTLRPVSLGDLEQVYQFCGDKEAITQMVYLPSDSMEETKETILRAMEEWQKETPEFHEFAVLLGVQTIGLVTVYFLEQPDTAELGWVLHKDYQGKGYATEAARAVMEYAMKELGFSHLIALCDKRNAASYHVMERLGFFLTQENGVRYNRSEDGVPAVELTYTFKRPKR